MAKSSPRAMTKSEWFLLVILSVIWGSSFLMIKYALRGFQPFTLVWLRVTGAAILLLLILRLQGKRLPKGKAIWLDFLVIAFFSNMIPFSLIMWSETQISSSLTSVLNASAPLWGVSLALVFRTEHVNWKRLLGVLLGFGGVIIMIGMGSLDGLGVNVLAQLGMLAATLCYTLAGNYTQRIKHMDPVMISAGQVICSSIVMLPIAILVDQPWLRPAPPVESWLAAAGLGLLGTAVAYMIYFRLLTTAGTNNALLVTFLIPINGVLLGILVLGESFAPYQFAGMFLILLGLIAIDGRVFRLLIPQSVAE